MREHLIIRLDPPDGAEAHWLRVDEHGRRLGESGSGTLSQAAQAAAGHRVSVLVPGTEVLLTSLRLPIRNAEKLRRALPYSLEEQLAEDVERLHFAASRPGPGGEVQAAVVSRERMNHWLQRLGDVGLQPRTLVSDAQAVPANPGSLTLVLEGMRIYLVPADGPAHVFEGPSIEQVLGVADAAQASPARHLLVYCEQQHEAAVQTLAQSLREEGREIDLHRLPAGATARMAAGAVLEPGLNLLQGAYAVQHDYAARLRPWRAAAALAAALALLAVTAKGLEYVQLQRALDDVEAQISQVFRETFGDQPEADYRLQMQQGLARLRAGGADPLLLETLTALAQAMRQAPRTQVLAIAYREGVIDLRLRTPDVDTLDALRRELAASARLQSQIQAANPVDGGVEGRLRLLRGGA